MGRDPVVVVGLLGPGGGVVAMDEDGGEGLEQRLRGAWQGRVSGCMLGKAVEIYSMTQGQEALTEYLASADALPLRDYIPLIEGAPAKIFGSACRGQFSASAADDDINYSLLALELLEAHGRALRTEDVARAWLNRLPAGMTFTAERAAYRTLLSEGAEWFAGGAEPGFDLSRCSDNPYNEWIGAQIRADVYGWVTPGDPGLAGQLARVDAELSHRGDGVDGAVLVAAWGAALPGSANLDAALELASAQVAPGGGVAQAIALARKNAAAGDGPAAIHRHYAGMSPVHTLNNLALVVWALLRHPDDFGAAVGDVVAAGWDTDCNGATVGALWALQGKPVPEAWTRPWQDRVGVSLAGQEQLSLAELVRRTAAVARSL
ncbi:MAG TPA: ADP-ribosylglycohydrolase family protein [Myxococcales bacterium]|nr:ADP-ribosylglycohydrolase family protein [Myxococcales bacterium]HIL01227.1 ADP-ribosylglycohydrolase family protein [Myxococcales bacterium]